MRNVALPTSPRLRYSIRSRRWWWMAALVLAVASTTVASGAGAPAAGGGEAAPGAGTIVRRAPYVAATYDSVPALARMFPRAEYDSAVSDRRFSMERVVYRSGGHEVVAYVYGAAGRRRPTVVFNRGSYVRGDIGAELIPMFQRLAAAGFTVIAPLYRGSDGAGGRDEMGGDDLDDLMNVVPLAAAIMTADTSRLYLYGESRGGMMTYQALRDGFPAKAAVVFGAFTDLDSMIDARPDFYAPVVARIWPDFATRRAEIAERRSAARWADRLRVPLLILHGGADRDVDPKQSHRLAAELRRLGREHELHVYPGDNHVLKSHRIDRDARAVAWFVKHR